MKKEYNKLVKAESQYHLSLGIMEEVIVDKVLFEFSIQNASGDGFCILNEEDASLSPLEECLIWIKENGQLSIDDHIALAL